MIRIRTTHRSVEHGIIEIHGDLAYAVLKLLIHDAIIAEREE